MHIFSDVPVMSAEALKTANIQFLYTPEIATGTGALLYSPSYTAEGLIPLSEAADTFPAYLLGHADATAREAFLEWLIGRTTITAEESLKHHEGINMVWRKFQSIFRIIQGIIYYEPIYRAFVPLPLSPPPRLD